MKLRVQRSSPAGRHRARRGAGGAAVATGGDIDGFVAAVARHRGRPYMSGLPAGSGRPSGFWVSTSSATTSSAPLPPPRPAGPRSCATNWPTCCLATNPRLGPPGGRGVARSLRQMSTRGGGPVPGPARLRGGRRGDAEAVATALVTAAACRQRAAATAADRVRPAAMIPGHREGRLPMTLAVVGLAAAWLASGYRLWVSLRQPATLWRTAFTVGIVCAAIGVTFSRSAPDRRPDRTVGRTPAQPPVHHRRPGQRSGLCRHPAPGLPAVGPAAPRGPRRRGR